MTIGIHIMALAVLPGAGACAQQELSPPGAAPVIELRLASTEPVAGFARMSDPDQDRNVYVASASVLSDDDLTHVRSVAAPNGLLVELALSSAAAARLRETTRNAIGRHLAVLANGRLAGVALVAAAVPAEGNRDNLLRVQLTLPEDAADEVRARIRARWPVRPR